jgi:hypothetical protein
MQQAIGVDVDPQAELLLQATNAEPLNQALRARTVVPRREDGDAPLVKLSDALSGLLVPLRPDAYDGPHIEGQPAAARVLKRLCIGEYGFNDRRLGHAASLALHKR